MSDTPLPLPAGLRWIKLVCRLGRLAHDGADLDDKPDLLPTAGKVRLASTPARLRVQEADGRWRSVALDDREYTIRADGELVDTEGRLGVWFPDPASALLDPRPYMLVATVIPTVGERWAAKITGENLPDVVDLVAHSETVAVPASAVPGLSSRIASVEGILADGGGGVDVGPSHESILASGNVTLPTEHPVLTIRAGYPATLSIPEAPDGTVITAHVAYGWENLTWGPGITVTGDSATTETWVVMVRAEGKWQALVSGESGGGSGILTGNGNPNTLGVKAATVGVLYADEAKTNGAALWSANNVDYFGDTEWVVVKGYAEKYLTNGEATVYLRRSGPRLRVEVDIFLAESGNGEEVTIPASTIDFDKVEEGFTGILDEYSLVARPHALTLFTPRDDEYSPPVQLPPIMCVFTQSGRYALHMPEVVIPAYTSSDPVVVIGDMELTAADSWPEGSGGGGGGGF